MERDLWILDSLAAMRFLTTAHIARLFFNASRSATNKCMRRLFDAGLIRSWVRDLAKDNVYALTPAGRDALEDSAGPVGAAIACPRRLDGQLDHLLAINAVRAEFAMGLTDGVIVWWRSDWEMRGVARGEAVPDARFALRWPDSGEHLFAMEVEYHTRAPRTFLRKMLRYAGARFRALGSPSEETILVVGRHPSWLERYRQAVASLSLGQSIWFTTLAELEERGADGTIWRAATGENCASLRGLTRPPYGKAGGSAKNDAVARRHAPSPAHTYPLQAPNNGTL